MIFQIYEQKYLELLEDGETLEGVKCLRQDLAPLNIQTEHLQKLAQILFVQVQYLNLNIFNQKTG